MKFHYIAAALFFAACNNSKPAGNKEEPLPASLVSIPASANGLDTVAAALKPEMSFKDTLHDFGLMHDK